MNLPTSLVPMVIEKTQQGERAFDIYSRLLKERIIFLGTPVNDDVSSVIIAQLLFLEADDPDKDLLDFLQSSYEAGANLARWDRNKLERAADQPMSDF